MMHHKKFMPKKKKKKRKKDFKDLNLLVNKGKNKEEEINITG